jgi:hypothetical protein
MRKEFSYSGVQNDMMSKERDTLSILLNITV